MTEPNVVYKSERVTIYHGDSRVVLPTLPAESCDLVITDPPYGVEFESKFRSESFGQIHNDGTADRDGVREVLRECLHVLRPRRHLYAFGPSDVLVDLKNISRPVELIWDKGAMGMGDLSTPWAPAHEPISFVINKRLPSEVANPLAARMRKGSVLHFTRPTGRQVRHPNEKPVGLLRELIESSSRLGDVVLDPFAGSGSTAVAALLAGRCAVLVESDDRWLDLCVERVTAAEKVADRIEVLA